MDNSSVCEYRWPHRQLSAGFLAVLAIFVPAAREWVSFAGWRVEGPVPEANPGALAGRRPIRPKAADASGVRRGVFRQLGGKLEVDGLGGLSAPTPRRSRCRSDQLEYRALFQPLPFE